MKDKELKELIAWVKVQIQNYTELSEDCKNGYGIAESYYRGKKDAFEYMLLKLKGQEMLDEAEEIEAIPVADVQEVKHGQWIDKGRFIVMCSCCGQYFSRNLLFDYQTMDICPSCGAKMDLEEEEKEDERPIIET